MADTVITIFELIATVQQRLADAKYAKILAADFQAQLVNVQSAVEQARDIRDSAALDKKDVKSIANAINHIYATLRGAEAAVQRLPTQRSPLKWKWCGSDIKEELLRQSLRLDQQLNQLGTLTNQAAIKAQLESAAIEPVEVDARHEQRKVLAEQKHDEDEDADGRAPTAAELALQEFEEEHGGATAAMEETMATRRRVEEALGRLPRLQRAFDGLDGKRVAVEKLQDETRHGLAQWRRRLQGKRNGLATLQRNTATWELNKDHPDTLQRIQDIAEAEEQVTKFTEKLALVEANLRNPSTTLPAWDDDADPGAIKVTLEETLEAARECGAVIDADTWSNNRGRGLVEEKIRRLERELREADALVLDHLRYLVTATGGRTGGGGLVFDEVVRAVQEGTEGLAAVVGRAGADVVQVLTQVQDLETQVRPFRTDELPSAAALAGAGDVLPSGAAGAAAPPPAPPGPPRCEDSDLLDE